MTTTIPLTDLIDQLTTSASLGPIENDCSVPCTWRNGEVTTPGGDAVPMGGGWIESAESADLKNEELGIAGGLRQGVSYPNEVQAGAYTPYGYGEDESGWQDAVMPVLLGEDWQQHPDADDAARKIFAAVQAELASLA
jgi:hypothetical protein